MISRLLNPKYSLFVLFAHVMLGILASQNKYIFITWFFAVLVSEIPNLLRPVGRFNVQLNQVIVYLASFEILARMSRSSPVIPQEMSKYLLCILFLYGILNGYNKGGIGVVLLLLLIPALFIDKSGDVDMNNLVFNILGPIDLALGVIYFKSQHITQKQLLTLVKLGVLPLVATLMFAVIRTPDYDELSFALGSNNKTSGGFGSNQVSTVFGAGIFLLFILWISGKTLSKYKIVDLGLILLFVFQGFLTFSRGGILGAVVAILVTFFVLALPGNTVRGTVKLTLPKITAYAIPVIVLGLIVFQIANDITGNNLLLRYQGETAGTLAGMKEVNLNTMTSNRYDIFLGDIELWQDNIIYGVGAGASPYLRGDGVEEETAAHIELTRLLAEHGILGLLFFAILLVFPFMIIKENQNPLNRAILLSFYTIALFSSFHAAMRTYVTPLFLSLSMISIKELLPMSIASKKEDISIQSDPPNQ